MKLISKNQLQELDSRYRANLINSRVGYKCCNLLGTVLGNGVPNLALFNSVIHIRSNPVLPGFILRPLTVGRNTYTNFKRSGLFTVNQVNTTIYKAAHLTSAKHRKISENKNYRKWHIKKNIFQKKYALPVDCHLRGVKNGKIIGTT